MKRPSSHLVPTLLAWRYLLMPQSPIQSLLNIIPMPAILQMRLKILRSHARSGNVQLSRTIQTPNPWQVLVIKMAVVIVCRKRATSHRIDGGVFHCC